MSSSGKSSHATENGNLPAISVKQQSRSSIGKTKSNKDESSGKISEQFNCVLCPFVTNYQTNLLRHRREIHGIVGTRGHKSCKYCGHQAQTNDEIILHQQSAHQEILLRAREKFSRERRGIRSDNSHNSNKKEISSDMSLFRQSVSNEMLNSSSNGHFEDDIANQLDLSENGDDDGDFWKESFLDFPSNLISPERSMINIPMNHRYGQIKQSPVESKSFLDHHLSKSNSLGIDSRRGEDVLPNLKNSSNSKKRKSQKNAPPANEQDDLPLAPTRIKRQYNCSECDFQTFNPRQFLYHRRDQHGEKVKIVECPYCQYACQYFQKLQRHILLIHKLTTTTSPPGLSSSSVEKISMNGSLTNKKGDSTEKINDGSGNEFSSAANGEKCDQLTKAHQPLEENSLNKSKGDLEKVSKKQKKRKKSNLSIACDSFKCVSCDKEYPRKFASEKTKPGKQTEITNRCIKCSFLLQKKLSSTGQIGLESGNCNPNKNYLQLMGIRHGNHLQNVSSSSDGFANGLFPTENESNPDNPEYNLNSINISSNSKQTANRGKDSFHKSIRNKKERLSYDSIDFQDSNVETHDESCGNSINGDEEDIEDLSIEISSIETRSSISCSDNDSRTNDTQDMNGSKSKKKSRYRVYQCNHCDFRCPTPDRFHIHFLQHVNNKPFVCSECGHRSNWEWDVVKHIKMKLLRDPKHSKAKPVLINDSENIDYCKYDQFIVWTDDPTKFSTGSAQFMPAKRVKIVDEDALFEGPNEAGSFQTHCNGENYTENIIITPDLPFEHNSLNQSSRDDETNIYTSYRGLSNCMVNNILQPNVRYVSPPVPRPWMKYVRAFKCAYCSFSHHSTMQLVSHLSSHAGKKPYKCKHCSFSSNWKDVVVHHLNSRHDKSTKDIVQLLKYSVTNFICRIVELDNSSRLESTRNADSDGPSHALCET